MPLPTSRADNDLVAAFLAKRQPTMVAPGLAYGVSAEADKAKRLAERERRQAEDAEHRAEIYMEDVREAYHAGGSRARDEVMRDRRY